MTAHTHTEHVPGCYRCDLSRDEVTAPERDAVEVVKAALRDRPAMTYGVSDLILDSISAAVVAALTQAGHLGGQAEAYTVGQISEAFAKHASADGWGVPAFYEGGLLSALRGEFDRQPGTDEKPSPCEGVGGIPCTLPDGHEPPCHEPGTDERRDPGHDLTCLCILDGCAQHGLGPWVEPEPMRADRTLCRSRDGDHECRLPAGHRDGLHRCRIDGRRWGRRRQPGTDEEEKR
ncbi:hypothetical protein DNL40_02470 [Xylanimonas oleitrophica]|uniref:Uncharacterized protein n=1 Tax=Xylanimonas oleitrophica TaxID=2607479 RepID=A0A2W5X474_9MICO|nr:hypothetical protein [Xylanimonas oleitrophica]PZR55255.1 hypothetical protein DNL40_02470 [Xylanimonas oleitrophica]